MQNVICKVRNCGYCSASGFCLNRLVVINEQGVCNWLTKPGWNQQVSEMYKSNAGARSNPAVTEHEDNQGLDKSGKDRPPRD